LVLDDRIFDEVQKRVPDWIVLLWVGLFVRVQPKSFPHETPFVVLDCLNIEQDTSEPPLKD